MSPLIAAALAARARAYAPYSKFPVGACLEGADGRLHVGANVENAAYPQSQCAEASAIGAMIAAGETRIRAVVVAGAGPEACMPCGGCRQRLAEFSSPDVPVIAVDETGRELVRTTIGALLPLAFGPKNLG